MKLVELHTKADQLSGSYYLGYLVYQSADAATLISLDDDANAGGVLVINNQDILTSVDESPSLAYCQRLIDEGKITPEQAAVHPHRSLILKVLNGQVEFEPDLELIDARLGDRIMFCSDGLSGLVSDPLLRELLSLPDINEAIARLEKYLDDAMIAGLTSVRVVHGKGTGALRKGIHEYLRKLKFVKSYKLAEFGEGDAGVTIVTFK